MKPRVFFTPIAAGIASLILYLAIAGIGKAQTRLHRFPHWWYLQAVCIHRKEAINWHEKRNPLSRGGMQIVWGTWRSVGGHGDPADATPNEQYWRAWLIWRRDGGHWYEWTTAPLCGLA